MSSPHSPTKDFDLATILDTACGIKQVGDKEAYYAMLEGFQSTFPQHLNCLTTSYEVYDEAKFREVAFTIMATTGFLAAGRVYHMSSKIHGAYMRKEYAEEFSYYAQLLEEAILLKMEIKKALCSKKGVNIM